MSNVSNLAEAREARRLQQPQNNGGKGFALLHRKIMDVPFYKDAEAAHLWVHLILKAKYSPEYVMTELGEKLVKRGELLSGRNKLASETGLEPDRVLYLLRKFKKLGMISWESNTKFSIFRIEKYDDYQSNFVPAEYQQNTIANSGTPTAARDVVPADYQQITTDNKYINNNLLPNGSKYVATADENQAEKKPRLSCEEVWITLKECVPDARGWNTLTPKRRQRIQKFWREAKPIAKQLGDAEPFGMHSFRKYLEYLHTSCRWMFETRPDQKTGKVWQKRDYDYILNAELYAQVREGARDDR